MKRFTLETITVLLILGFFSLPVLASPASYAKGIGVELQPNGTDVNATDIQVTWQFAAGDILEKSVDGADWQAVAQTSDGAAVIAGVPNWSVLYLRVRTSGGSITPFTVFPPNQNAHDTYSANTNMCAGCHSGHGGDGPALLKSSNSRTLCNVCHGTLNTGSRYNTDNGAVISVGTKDPDTGTVTGITWNRSLAGPFTSNDMGVWGEGATVTSQHNVTGTTGTYPPGGHGQYRGDENCNRCHSLSCTSCHVVHGTGGTYRNLDTYFAPVSAYAYNPTGGMAEQPKYVSGMTQFCGYCHDMLLKPEGSATTLAGTITPLHGYGGSYPENKYRHATGVDLTYVNSAGQAVTANPTVYPTEGNPKTISCITCHFAHGTVSPQFIQTGFPLASDGTPRGTSGSMLLRSLTNAPNICLDCHPK